MHIRHCISCKKRLYSAGGDSDSFNSSIDGGIYLRSYGNYGSAVFDPCGRQPEQLEMYICDECLKSESDIIYSFNKRDNKEVDIHLFKKDLEEYENLSKKNEQLIQCKTRSGIDRSRII